MSLSAQIFNQIRINSINYYYLFAISILIISLFNKFTRKHINLPPGPFGLPIIGHLGFLGFKPHVKLTEWGKKYGKIFTLKFGTFETVVLNDYKLIKETFSENKYSGRPDIKAFKAISGGNQGIGNTEGAEWSEQRRFTMRHLRDFGFGKKSMENLIAAEAAEVVANLRNETGKPISLGKHFSLAVLNSLLVILTGQRYELNHPKLNELLHNYETAFRKVASNPIPLIFPSLMETFPKLTGWNSFVSVINSMHQMFKKDIEAHKEKLGDSEPNDFIDTYLKKISDTTDVTSSFYKKRGESSLVGVLADLFGGGSETTSVTLNWAILYLILHEEDQTKVQEEIDKVVGSSRTPSLNDRPMMPYTEAVILETLRKSSLAPLGVFHRATRDGTINGFDIPKGTLVVANLYAVHHDESLWENPSEFNPQRFLPLGSREGFLPFSTGKRTCPGESLGRDSLFLFLTHILQAFNIRSDPSRKGLNFEPINGKIFLNPQEYKVILMERSSTTC